MKSKQITNKNLQKELILMAKKDQKMINSKKWNIQVIKNNTQRLKHIIAKYGWPHSKLSGMAGESAAWLIAQHSDYYIKFQEKCLKLLKRLPATKQRKVFVAYLTDRVLVNQKKKQVYGTQFNNGEPRPIENIASLDSLRKKMNLCDFATYKKHMEKVKRIS